MQPENVSQQFGTLEFVALRQYWADEARDFTPWLAQAGNLGRLSETLGLDLEVEGIEIFVGPYRADIVARDLGTNERVIIENQLEKTDHSHLGQMIVYAAGLEAKTLIWVAREFTEEHRRALDFLNEHTVPELRLYAVEAQLWRIGDSLPAPLFKVVSRPNTYTAAVRQSTAVATVTDNFYLDFWTGFRDYCERVGAKPRPRNPTKDSWIQYSVGRTGFAVQLAVSKQRRHMYCALHIQNDPNLAIIRALRAQQAAIEQELGPLDWKEDSHVISVYRREVDSTDRTTWEDSFRWLNERSEAFRRVFGPRVKLLTWDEPGADERDPVTEIDTSEMHRSIQLLEER